MQAYLHFKPDMFYKLFTYQKIFCRLVDRYRFDACYAYDREMRMQNYLWPQVNGCTSGKK